MNKCKHCGKDCVRIFCNSSCAAKFNNVYRIRKVKIKNKCLWCGLETSSCFCSNECYSKYKVHININKWLVTGNFWSGIKEFIFKEQGEKCNHCGISDWNDKPLSFELEHKDGNAQNNKRGNLEVICPNCHAQTSTYRGKNVGNPSRLKYYYKMIEKRSVSLIG